MTVIHLDPTAYRRLLALPERELRTLIALLGVAPAGIYVGGERKLANVVGLKPTELRAVLAALAGGEEPLIAVSVRRDRQLRVEIRNVKGVFLWINDRAGPKSVSHVKPADRNGLEKMDSSLLAALRSQDPDIADLAVAWLAHLDELWGRRVPSGVAYNSLSTIGHLLAEYGAELTASAIRSGLANVTERHGGRPDRYLEATVIGLSEGRPALARSEVPPDIEF